MKAVIFLGLWVSLVGSTGCAVAKDEIAVVLPPSPTSEERIFADTILTAFKRKDPALLTEISHWKSSEGKPTFFAEFYGELLKRGCKKLTIERVDPKLATERIENNERIRESLPVSWVLVVYHSTTASISTDMNAGLDEGIIKLTTSSVVKESEK
ncbi:MAG: hypothetical protein QM715_18800 [Nibricoccus sp.]